MYRSKFLTVVVFFSLVTGFCFGMNMKKKNDSFFEEEVYINESKPMPTFSSMQDEDFLKLCFGSNNSENFVSQKVILDYLESNPERGDVIVDGFDKMFDKLLLERDDYKKLWNNEKLKSARFEGDFDDLTRQFDVLKNTKIEFEKKSKVSGKEKQELVVKMSDLKKDCETYLSLNNELTEENTKLKKILRERLCILMNWGNKELDRGKKFKKN